MSTTITYFVHGTTIDNERGLATGWRPGELSPKGRQETIELGRSTAHHKFDAVFASDLQRAIQSAELVFGSSYTILTDPRLRECHYGDFEGGSAAAFKNRLEHYIDTPFPGGESYRDVEHRMRSFLNNIIQNYPNGHIAVVAHQAPQLALDVLLKAKTWPEAFAEDWRKTRAWQPGWEYLIR